MKYKISLVLILTLYISSFSQKKKYCILEYNQTPIKTVLKDIEKCFDVKFSYSSDLLKDILISLPKDERDLNDLLFEITASTNLDFNKLDSKYIYITKNSIQNLKEVIVRNYLTKGITKNKDASFVFSSRKLGLLAGLTEADVLESIQQLPGVISSSETATELNVRGGTQDQNQIIWDNINIYHGGHLFGMVSVFNPNVADKITFHNKGTNAKFGDRISSVIDVKTTKIIPKKTNIEIGINGISTDAYINTPVIQNKFGLQFSFRRSYEDIYENLTFRKFEEKAFQNTNINDEFFYFKDYNVKANIQVNKNNFVELSYIHVDNDLESEYNTENNFYSDILDSENDGYSLKWNSKFNTKTSLEIGASLSNYRLDYLHKTSDTKDLISTFTKQNYITDSFIFTQFNKKINKTNTLNIGYQYNLKDVSFLFKDKKDIIYILDKDYSAITTHAIYGNYSFKTKGKLDYILGFRTNYYENFNTFKLEPRFVITKELSDKFKLQFTGEIKNQIISQIDETVLSNLSLENKIWRLADGEDFPIINARQISLGGIYNFNKLTVDMDIYHKTVDGITALSLGFLNPLDNQFHIGVQKINGVDVYLKKRLQKFNTWISYSFLNVQNKYEGLNNNKYFTANTQISHAFSTTINYNNKGLKVALSWILRTGKPLTDLDYTETGDAYFHGINTENHPIYHRLDLSGVYHFKITEKIRAKTGLSIRNMYNNKNHIDTEFHGNNTIDDPIQIKTLYSIGITPNFMFRVYF